MKEFWEEKKTAEPGREEIFSMTAENYFIL
jgi:hypothetical protein